MWENRAPVTTVDPIPSEERGPSGTSGQRPHTRATIRLGPRRRPARILTIGLAGVVLFYGAVGYWGSGLMIGDNPRWRGMTRGPQDFALAGETVSFSTDDGVQIEAWWLPAMSPARGIVIVTPGGDHTRQAMLPRAAFLVRGGYDVLAIDLRGHGESGGQFISPGLVERHDVMAAIRYVRSRGGNSPIALLGVCVGGVASLLAAAEAPGVAAVIRRQRLPLRIPRLPQPQGLLRARSGRQPRPNGLGQRPQSVGESGVQHGVPARSGVLRRDRLLPAYRRLARPESGFGPPRGFSHLLPGAGCLRGGRLDRPAGRRAEDLRCHTWLPEDVRQRPRGVSR
ncbi:MAG: alpha/beta hydrolase, partial [Gammaproteobacteria bacterium]|nr:alpha/beta hydrolase [Gammaproteobacteria bacterium]